MASSHHTQFETLKLEQIITEFFAKSLHIILESRSPCTSSRSCGVDQVKSFPYPFSRSSSRSRDKWFHLALGDCSGLMENIDLCGQGHPESMVVDVILAQSPRDLNSVDFSPKRDLVRNLSAEEQYQFFSSSDHESKSKSEKIVERWLVQYESGKSRDISSGSRRSNNITLQTMYKKSILLLRSLYATIRLLPAHKIFRELCSASQIHPFTLAHRVSSFVEPFTHREDTEIQQFRFTPVDTPSGKLCISIFYHSALSDAIFEPSTPVSPQFIADYVGSPLIDPLKRFPAIPLTGALSNGSPSSFPCSKPHSWSHNRYRASPPSFLSSPPPAYPELHSSISAFQPEKAYHKKNTKYGGYLPFPTFSSSLPASLSPPIYTVGTHISKASLQPQSAPVNVPAAKPSSFPKFSNKDIGPLQAGPEHFSAHGEDCRNYSGREISSNGSPQNSISRSSSQSFLNEFDDCEFRSLVDPNNCYVTDQSHRPESFEQKGCTCDLLDSGGLVPIRKSQEAVLGALVHELKKAGPLREDLFNIANNFHTPTLNAQTNCNNEEVNRAPEQLSPTALFTASVEVTCSRPTPTKTIADALEELQSYRAMKVLLLGQGGYSHVQAKNVSVSDSSSE